MKTPAMYNLLRKAGPALHALALMIGILLAGSVHAQTIIYVDQTSTGNGDGSTWVDAFNHLQDALDVSEAGNEIWIASGTYLPGDSLQARFVVSKDVRIYGGFAGAETSLDEREPLVYPTILSGDVLGDDLPSNTQDNRWDNLYTILEITPDVTTAAVIDGLVFRGGHASGDNVYLTNAWGGAVFCAGAPQIRGCLFADNFAEKRGGAIYIQSDNANDMLIQNCLFEGNRSNEDGGAIFINQTIGTGVFIESCSFSLNNSDRRGGGIAVYNASSQINGCSFNNNLARQSGGAIQVQASFNFLRNGVDSCTFNLNQATRGGAVHMISSSVFGAVGNEFEITRSSFDLNEANDFTNNPNDAVQGGALKIESNVNASETKAIIAECVFTNNYSSGSAAVLHIQFDGQESSLVFVRNLAQKNLSQEDGPLNIAARELGEAAILLDSCLWTENHSSLGAAGIILNATDNTHVDFRMNNVVIEKGNAANTSGLIVQSSGQAHVRGSVQNSLWSENSGNGCFRVEDATGQLELHIRNVELDGNASFGTSILSFTGTSSGTTEIAHTRLENMLIHHHSGGNQILYLENMQMHLLNVTSAENETPGIHVGQDATLELQNSILANLGEPELVTMSEGGSIYSHGGNIINDDSFIGWSGSSDLINTDPAFLNLTEFNLSASSPAVDFGTMPDSISSLDLAGNPRIQGKGIDAGALESPFTSSIANSKFTLAALDVWPNPTTEEVMVTMVETLSSPATIRICDASGHQLEDVHAVIPAGQYQASLFLAGVPAGTYTIQVVAEEGIRAVGSLVVVPSR